MDRVAIVGTANSWRQTPWSDPSLRIVSLNDAYHLKGFQRADEWYDLHPPDKWHLIEQPIMAHQVPPGHYARPGGHVTWMRDQQIPIWLHPDYATLRPDLVGPHLRAFPRAELQEAYGDYETSSPSWMVAHLYHRGFRHIEIYGIHLATEFEYMRQRPNLEYLLGRILGMKVTKKVTGGMRYYEGTEAVVGLPESSPVLQSDFIYAFEPRPDAHVAPLQWDVHRYSVKRQRALKALIERRWYQRATPLRAELAWREAQLADAHEQLQREAVQQAWG